MDKGKGKANEWMSSVFDSNIGPLKKHKVDYEAIIEELCRERDYWKNAYLKEHRLYQVYSRGLGTRWRDWSRGIDPSIT